MKNYIVTRNVVMEQTLFIQANSKKEAIKLVNEESDLIQIAELEAIKVNHPKFIKEVSPSRYNNQF